MTTDQRIASRRNATLLAASRRYVSLRMAPQLSATPNTLNGGPNMTTDAALRIPTLHRSTPHNATLDLEPEPTAEVEEPNAVALRRELPDLVGQYDAKVANATAAVAAFNAAGEALKEAACIEGTWGHTTLDVGRIGEREVLESLLKSAWRHTYAVLQIDRIASAQDRRKFEQAMTNPAPFTAENVRATFGPYISNPRLNILRGLAEVFSDLDPAYKSHEKVKIGVAGLPKRIIMSGFGDFSYYGRDKVRDVLNALAAYQGKPMTEYAELKAMEKDEDALADYDARGVRLRRFANGNGHLFFEPRTLRDINMALAEFYGDVLPDCEDDEPAPRQSTAVAKDLQYYPTPQAVVDRIVGDLYIQKGERVLEPSCGCGRFLDALRAAGATVVGVEVHPGRIGICRGKGHKVMATNFLETVPTGDFDRVVMNPPFYGKHYAKHVRHAFKFLKPGGTLTAILPATARYDHGLLDDLIKSMGRYSEPWSDLPVGAFSESGTNINTSVLTLYAPR